MQTNPYFNFNGQCREAFTFYAETFGGNIEAMLTHENMPSSETTPADWRSMILHARMTVGDTILMGSDTPPEYYEAPKGQWTNIETKSAEEAERVFHALAEGGTIQSPLNETFFADRWGLVTDRFGIPWMINSPKSA